MSFVSFFCRHTNEQPGGVVGAVNCAGRLGFSAENRKAKQTCKTKQTHQTENDKYTRKPKNYPLTRLLRVILRYRHSANTSAGSRQYYNKYLLSTEPILQVLSGLVISLSFVRLVTINCRWIVDQRITMGLTLGTGSGQNTKIK